MDQLIWGRKLLKTEISWDIPESSIYLELPTIEQQGYFFRCLRCGSLQQIRNELRNFDYCRFCLQLGRVQSNQVFYHLPQPLPQSQKIVFEWKNQLSNSQELVSEVLVKCAKNKQHHLVWAVTGAGKTEMLFEMIRTSLERGERIALASPRVDVCLELYPRLQAVFPFMRISLLYAEQKVEYFYSNFVICTTHQLLRFYQAFDVLIIDEVDAFPFVNNQQLAFGVSKAKKEVSSLIYLTATPTKAFITAVAKGELSLSKVTVRYHQVALPVPELSWIWKGEAKVRRHVLPYKLEQRIREQFAKKRTTLLFCPQISLMETLVKLIRKEFPNNRVEGVHASHPKRQEIVLGMREKAYDLLLTTTILERGVTFKGIDVIVFESNHGVFNEASLVQIAGRAGRSADEPYGKVYFFHSGRSKAMKKAIEQIEDMNQLARSEGRLKE